MRRGLKEVGAVGYTLLIAAVGLVVALTAWEPAYLGDQNGFIKEFADSQSLNILGVIIAIFLPSSATLYIRLSELQRELGRDFGRYRRIIKFNCIVVICLFVVTSIALIIKGGNAHVPWMASAVNGIVLVVVLANLLVLVDLTMAMFDVGEVSSRPFKRENADGKPKEGS